MATTIPPHKTRGGYRYYIERFVRSEAGYLPDLDEAPL